MSGFSCGRQSNSKVQQDHARKGNPAFIENFVPVIAKGQRCRGEVSRSADNYVLTLTGQQSLMHHSLDCNLEQVSVMIVFEINMGISFQRAGNAAAQAAIGHKFCGV